MSQQLQITETLEALPDIVSALRNTYLSGRTRTYDWRKQQLSKLRQLLVENKDEVQLMIVLTVQLVAAQRRDFRAEYLAVNELLGEISAVEEMLSNLDEYLKPKKAEMLPLFLPSSGYVVSEPYGVVAIFSPWNYPIALLIQPLIGAIAGGNCAVIKPSEYAVNVSNVFAKLIPAYEMAHSHAILTNRYLDTHSIRLVTGEANVSIAMLELKWDFIFFTGSTPVGKSIMEKAAKHLTPVLLELGGKSPVFVHSDANLALAAKRIIWGKCMNAGQTCIAPDYLLAEATTLSKLIPLLKQYINEFYTGNVRASVDYDRIVNIRHLNRLQRLLAGENIIYGAVCSISRSPISGGTADQDTLFMEPTLVLNSSPSSPIMQEEIFGPILPLITVNSPEDALRFINERDKPLSLYVYATSSTIKRKFETLTNSGALVFNDQFIHSIIPSLPFGGVGPSGIGAYHGEHTFTAFTHPKPVVDATTMVDSSVRYPPYNTFKMQLAKILLPLRHRTISRMLHVLGVGVLSVVLLFHRESLTNFITAFATAFAAAYYA